MNQQVFKGKKKAAESGHRLLKKKADALKVRQWMWTCLLFGDPYSIAGGMIGIQLLCLALSGNRPLIDIQCSGVLASLNYAVSRPGMCSKMIFQGTLLKLDYGDLPSHTPRSNSRLTLFFLFIG
jgi:hypothetical protein